MIVVYKIKLIRHILILHSQQVDLEKIVIKYTVYLEYLVFWISTLFVLILINTNLNICYDNQLLCVLKRLFILKFVYIKYIINTPKIYNQTQCDLQKYKNIIIKHMLLGNNMTNFNSNFDKIHPKFKF